MSRILASYMVARAKYEEAKEQGDRKAMERHRRSMVRAWAQMTVEEQGSVDTFPGCPEPFEDAT